MGNEGNTSITQLSLQLEEAIYYSYLEKGYEKLDLVYKNYNNNIKRRDYIAANPITRGRSRGGRSTINTTFRGQGNNNS